MNRFNLAIAFVLFGLLPILQANDFALTTNEQAEVRQTLEDFQNGKVSLDEITVDRDETWGRKVLGYFVTHTNEVTTKMKLPISRIFAGLGGYRQAAILAQEYVSVYSNDWHGWRILGSADLSMTNFSGALRAYTNAVRLGDDGSVVPLAFMAMKMGELDVVRANVHRLFAIKGSKETESVKPLDAVTALVLYSLRSNQQDIFLKALDGVDASTIASKSDLEFLVKQGCRQFKGRQIDAIRHELQRTEKP